MYIHRYYKWFVNCICNIINENIFSSRSVFVFKLKKFFLVISPLILSVSLFAQEEIKNALWGLKISMGCGDKKGKRCTHLEKCTLSQWSSTKCVLCKEQKTTVCDLIQHYCVNHGMKGFKYKFNNSCLKCNYKLKSKYLKKNDLKKNACLNQHISTCLDPEEMNEIIEQQHSREKVKIKRLTKNNVLRSEN